MNLGTYPAKGAAARDQDVHGQETYQLFNMFTNSLFGVQFLQNFNPDRGQSVDELWTNCGQTVEWPT